MNTKQLITTQLHTEVAESFVHRIQEDGSYYVFVAKHTPYSTGSDDNPPVPVDNIRSSIQIYNDMIFGKRIKQTDAMQMIARNDWAEGTVYDMFDDLDEDIYNKNYYVVVDNNVELNVYKCLYNNGGVPSTQQPLGKDLSPIEFPQDGYIWKYMYTVDQFDNRRFGTADYLPVVEDTAVADAAVAGSIEIIAVDEGGYGYNNYQTSGTFPLSTDIGINGNLLYYGLDSAASNIDTYYNNCLLKITSGGALNEYRLIVDYFIENGKKVAVLDRPFNGTIRAGDEYEIYPNVFVYDINGVHTDTCIGRAIISANTGNSVSRVEVLNAGSGYRLAQAKLKPANTVGVVAAATVRPIISPAGGHGSRVYKELNARYVGVTTSFVGNTIPFSSNNDYRTIGLLYEPKFANVNIKLDSNNVRGSFIKGENIFRYKPIKLFGNVSISANSLVTGTDTSFIDTFRNNDRVVITNGITNILANVQSIASETSLKIDQVPSFTGSNCSIFLIEAQQFGIVTAFDSLSVTATEVQPAGWELSSFLLGETSFCTAAVSNTQPYVTVNGRDAEEFNAFNQLSMFKGTMTSTEAFIEDEILVQDITGIDSEETPTAVFHSSHDNPGTANDFLYITNVSNVFQPVSDGGSGVIRGLTSNAYFTAQYKYNGEIIPDSGTILYLENLKPITRSYKQTETVKLILEF